MKNSERSAVNKAFEVVQNSDFRLFLFYRFFLTSATLMQSVILSWQLYDITKNVFSLGLIGLVEVIPQISIALFAGYFVDLYNRRKIIVLATTLLVLGSVILCLYSLYSHELFPLLGTVPLFITVFITGLVRGILMPAHTAFMGQLIKRELLASASTWSSTVWHIAAVFGPAMGGLIYGFFGVVIAYLVVFSFFLAGLLVIYFTHNGTQVLVTPEINKMFKSIMDGVKFVRGNQVLFGAFMLDMFAVLFGGAVALLPAFASDILFAGPKGLGFLRSCPAIGAIIMSIYLTFKPPIGRSGRLLFISVIGFGLSMIAFGLSKNFYLSSAILCISGIFDNVSVVIRGTILQLYTPNEMRGRVSSVNSIFVGSSNELGAFESGLTARYMGLVPAVIFGGAMTLLVTGFTAIKSPKLRKLSLGDLV